jgi:hypothetical protein
MGSGNFLNGSAGPTQDAQYKILNGAGTRMCRFDAYPYDYWDFTNSVAKPQNFDAACKQAQSYGVTPMILFEHYGSYPAPMTLGDYNKWFAIGQAFAGRFRPNSSWWTSQGIKDFGISVFTAMNEPDINGPYIDRTAYHDALKGLADGVHSVDSTLKVIPCGFAPANAFGDYTLGGYGTAIVDLSNDGTLDGIDLHTYSGYWTPVKSNKHSAQHDFDAVKAELGVTRDINYYCTEFNYQRTHGEGFSTSSVDIGEDAASKYLLTTIWDELGVVGSSGQGVSRLALLWNLFQENGDPPYDTAQQMSPWVPTQRAKTYQMMAQLTAGMSFTALDPKTTGEFVLAGTGGTVWVWQDRANWTNHPGTSHTVSEIPAGATKLDVYGWDGLRASIALSGQDSYTVNDLPGEATYLFVADASGGTPPSPPSPNLLPDLTVEGLSSSPSGTMRRGTPVTFQATLTNRGTASAPAGVIVACTVDGVQVATGTTTAPLAAGASVTITAASPWIAVQGTHAVGALADPTNAVAESDETNNATSSPLSLSVTR